MTLEMLEISRNHLHNIIKERGDNALNAIMKEFITTYTYDAISLEGQNRIPYEDVKRLIEVGSLLEYSEREQKEVLNHVFAFEKVLELVKLKQSLHEESLKDIHEILVKGIFQGGVYRNVNIQMMGSQHQPTDHAKVYDRMHKLFSQQSDWTHHALELAVQMHAGLAKIHPFLDANGRLARLVLNYFLMTNDYLPITIPVQDKHHYIDLLEIYKSSKNIEPLKAYVTERLVKRYEDVIEALDI